MGRRRRTTRGSRRSATLRWVLLVLLCALAPEPVANAGAVAGLVTATESDLEAASLRHDVTPLDIETFWTAGRAASDVGRGALILFAMEDWRHLERDLRAVQASFDLDARNRGDAPYLLTGVVDARKSFAFAQRHGVVSFPSVVLFWKPLGREAEVMRVEDPDEFRASRLIEVVNANLGTTAQAWDVARTVTTLDAKTFDILVEDPNSRTLVVLCCGGGVSADGVAEALERLASRRCLSGLALATSSDLLLCERFRIASGVAAAIYYDRGATKSPVLVASAKGASAPEVLAAELERELSENENLEVCAASQL